MAGEREAGCAGGNQRDEGKFIDICFQVLCRNCLLVSLKADFGNQAANQAKNSEPAASGIGGRVEELAGKAAGCEGMEKEGLERQEKAT
jgi:hypothetical protein